MLCLLLRRLPLQLLLVALLAEPTLPFPFEGAALQLRGGQMKMSVEDTLTLEQVAIELAAARSHVHAATGADDDMVSKMILTTRMASLPLARCKMAPSTIANAGHGLFSTRDIAQVILVSLLRE